jgi:tetratricopeptide (TPR) repeat protein
VALGLLTFRQCRDYADERTLWESVVARNPGAWIAHNNLAQLEADRGDDARALAHLERGLALPASRAARDQMLFNRARALGRLGRHAEALATLLDLSARGVAVEPHVAAALERLERDAEAESWYVRALETPARRDVLLRLGALRLRTGRPDAALAPLAERVAEFPDDLDARMFLCEAQAAAGRAGEALHSAEAAHALALARGDRATAARIAERIELLRLRGR